MSTTLEDRDLWSGVCMADNHGACDGGWTSMQDRREMPCLCPCHSGSIPAPASRFASSVALETRSDGSTSTVVLERPAKQKKGKAGKTPKGEVPGVSPETSVTKPVSLRSSGRTWWSPYASYRHLERQAVAVHEACHAVVGVLGGGVVDEIRFTETGGIVTWNRQPDGPSGQAMMRLAGSVGLALYSRQTWRFDDHEDRENAARELGVDESDPVFEGYQNATRDALTNKYMAHAVERVADALLRYGSLSGAEVAQIIEPFK